MTINSLTSLENALSRKEQIPFYIANLGTVNNAYLYNPFHSANIISSYDIPNTALATPALFSAGGTSYSNGSLNLKHSSYTNSYIAGLNFQAGTTVGIDLYDRIWSCSGLGLVATTPQAFSSFPTIDRYENDYNLSVFVEVYTTLVNSSTITATITYTDMNDVTGKTTLVTIPVSAPKSILIPITCGLLTSANAKDVIKKIESVTLSAAATSGDFGLTVMRKLTDTTNTIKIPGREVLVSAQSIRKDWSDIGLTKLNPSACICPVIKPNTTTTGIISGNLIIARD